MKRFTFVSYARVSTKSQADRGASLEEQEDRFQRFIEESGQRRLKAYKESRSGGDVAHRKQFLAMLAELPMLHPKVDVLVVDSLDRFTRDMFLGVEMLAKLRDMGVSLLELERSWDTPLDMSSDGDRDYVWEKFQDAERERRRIKARQLKRYAEQRRRGNATTNRPAFGIVLVGERKGHRHLEADPDAAPIVQEIDRRILSGESFRSVLNWLADIPGAVRSTRGLSLMLADKHSAYVKVGIRTLETQQKLRDLLAGHKQSYGPDRTTKSTNEHVLSGLVACKCCVDAGIEPSSALMSGHYIKQNKQPYSLVCLRTEKHGGKTFYAGAHLVMALIVEKLERLRDERVAQAVLERWAEEPAYVKSEALRQSLTAQLSDCDNDAAAIDERVNAAFTMIAKGGALAAEAERVIERANRDRAATEARRAGLLEKLEKVPVHVARDPLTLGDLQIDAAMFPAWERDANGVIYMRSVRDTLKKWVRHLGPPMLERHVTPKTRKAKLKLHWPLLDSVKVSKLDYGPEVYDATDALAG